MTASALIEQRLFPAANPAAPFDLADAELPPHVRPNADLGVLDITKWFGENEAKVQALRGLDLEIGMGEFAMLVGPSGCGKTTLISIIAGLLLQFPTVLLAMPVLISFTVRRHHMAATPAAGVPQPTPAE